jgi:hypothetical protein
MTKTTPHSIIYAEDVFKSNVILEKDKLIVDPSVNPSFIRELKKTVQKDIITIYSEGEDLKCPLCGEKLNKNGFRRRLLNKIDLIFLQKYKCLDKECGFEKVTNIDHIVPKGCNYENDVRYDPIKQSEISYKSLEKISENIEVKYQTKPSRQSILNFMDNEGEKYLNEKCEDSLSYDVDDLSGIFAIDEQFPSVNGEYRARPIIMDVHTNIILNDITIPIEELDVDFKENFLNDTLKDKNVHGIVSDGDKSYATIIDEMQVPHQLCNFHIMHNLMSELIKPLNKLKRKIKTTNEKIEKIKENLPFYKSKKVRKKNQKKLKKLKSEKREYKAEFKELENYKDRISNIFKQKNIEKAKRRFKILYNNVNNLPPVIATFIRRLSKIFDKTVNHMIYSFLPSTNNQLECYNGVSLPDNQKRIYRTDRGLDRAIRLGMKRWMERNRKKIPKIKSQPSP